MSERKPPRPVRRGSAGTPQSHRSDSPESTSGLGRSSGVLDVPGPLDPLDETQDIAPERLREMARKSLLDLDRSLNARKEADDVDWDAEPTKVTTSPFADLSEPSEDDPPIGHERRPVLPRPSRPTPSNDAPRPAADTEADAEPPQRVRPRPRSKTLVGVGAFMGPSGLGTSPIVPLSPPEAVAAPGGLPPPPPSPPADVTEPLTAAPPDGATSGEAEAGALRDSVPRRVLPPLAASPVRPDAARAAAAPSPMTHGSGPPAPLPGTPERTLEPELPTSPRQSPPSMKPAMAPRVQVPAPLAFDGRFDGREDTGPSRQNRPTAPPRQGLSRLGLVMAVALPLGAGIAAGLLFFRPAARTGEVPEVAASATAIPARAAVSAGAPASHAPEAANEPATDDKFAEDEARGAAPEGAKGAEAPAPAADDSLLGRVRQGDPAAVEQLEAKPELDRTVEESIALAQGRVVVKRRAFAELEASLRSHPETLADKLATVRDFIDDRDTAIAALQMLTELPGELGADVIYDVWVGTRGRNDTIWLAEQLCHTQTVRSKASQALQVALALRSTEECEPIRDMLPQVAEHGDQRSGRLVSRLLKRTGCGDNGRKDCFECLRPLDRDKKAIGVRTALSHVRSRRAPTVR